MQFTAGLQGLVSKVCRHGSSVRVPVEVLTNRGNRSA
jgi:hypothetical protein